jgi:hypothetical protein
VLGGPDLEAVQRSSTALVRVSTCTTHGQALGSSAQRFLQMSTAPNTSGGSRRRTIGVSKGTSDLAGAFSAGEIISHDPGRQQNRRSSSPMHVVMGLGEGVETPGGRARRVPA